MNELIKTLTEQEEQLNSSISLITLVEILRNHGLREEADSICGQYQSIKRHIHKQLIIEQSIEQS